MSIGTRSTDRRMRQLLLASKMGVVTVFFLLAVSFWSFQVVEHERFSEMADNNYLQSIGLRAPRGVVFDREGRVLVENRSAFNITIVRERIDDLEVILRRLAAVTRVDLAAIRRAVERNAAVPPHRPIAIIRNASHAQVAAVTARRWELPGVAVSREPTRYYPGRMLAAHSFGYVGEITDDQLDAAADDRLRPGVIVGQSGIEQAYNTLLMGRDGVRQVVVNNVGREMETVGEVPPDAGRQIRLTLDVDLQRAAEDAFRIHGRTGAAVALDPRSGEVLALVSVPAYDPNDFAAGIDRGTWSSLNTDRHIPLQNRAIQGRYPPGSIFKIVTAIAALEEGLITPAFTVPCRGGGTYYGRFYRCHSAHGTLTLDAALEKSCNTYFYAVGSRLDIDVINRWASALGLGVRSRIDLPHEAQGLVPSRAWKRQRLAEPWYPGETLSVVIGQGAVAVTPISLAVMMSAVVNGGVRVVPHLLQAVKRGVDWRAVRPAEPPPPVALAAETRAAVVGGLWMAVNRAGTGTRARIAGRDVVGKSGTAQVVSLARGAETEEPGGEWSDHGWFLFAAPRDDPRIAGIVFVEHAGRPSPAAPIARHIMQTFFARQAGLPLPVLPVTASALPAADPAEASG